MVWTHSDLERARPRSPSRLSTAACLHKRSRVGAATAWAAISRALPYQAYPTSWLRAPRYGISVPGHRPLHAFAPPPLPPPFLQDAARFRALGAPSVTYGPSLKFGASPPLPPSLPAPPPPVWVCNSLPRPAVGEPSASGDALARFRAAVRGKGAVFACASLHKGEFAAAVEVRAAGRCPCPGRLAREQCCASLPSPTYSGSGVGGATPRGLGAAAAAPPRGRGRRADGGPARGGAPGPDVLPCSRVACPIDRPGSAESRERGPRARGGG